MLGIAERTIVGLPLGALGWQHYLLFALIVLLLFGGKRLPELARGLARGLRIFRDELHGVKRDLDDATKEPPPQPQDKIESKPDEPSEEKKEQH